jgi:hypothetical protein
MDDDIVWHQAQGLTHGGTYHGLPAVRAAVFDPLDEQWWDDFGAVPEEILGGEDHVVVLGRYTARAKGSGKPLDSIADRGYVLSTGRLVLEGKAADLLDDEGLRKAYLGR